METKVEQLLREGVGTITEKWVAVTGRNISYRQGTRYALHGKHGVVLVSAKIAGRRVTSEAAVLRFLQELEDACLAKLRPVGGRS